MAKFFRRKRYCKFTAEGITEIHIERWTTDVQVTRFSKLPNAAQDAYITPSSIANVSTQFRLNDSSDVRVIVNNVFDTIKDDPSFGWPYYPVGNYSPYGRQYWMEFDYRFQ